MAVVYDEIKKSFAPDTPVMIGGDLNTNTFDGNDIPGFTKLFNDPERLAKHMAAVEKYERVLPQAEENTWAEPGSALAKFTGPELSDHNACWADCRFAK